MEHVVITINGRKLLKIITKSSILDVAAVLDLPLLPAFASKSMNSNLKQSHY